MFLCEQLSVTWAEAGDGVHRVHENAATEIERSRLTCVPTIKVRSGRPLKPPPVLCTPRSVALAAVSREICLGENWGRQGKTY